MAPEIAHLYVNRYVAAGMNAMPDLVESLLADLSQTELDARPDPERFTLREAIAHLADWEGVWMERMKRMQDEENPIFGWQDPAQKAIDNDYAHADLFEQLAKFRTGRKALLAYLTSLSQAQLIRTGEYAMLKNVTVAEVAGFIWGHDGYHLQQILDFRKQSMEGK